MGAVEVVTTKVRTIANNKGHVRLFLVASLVWMVVAGLLSWQPLVQTYDDVLTPSGGIHNAQDIDLAERDRPCFDNALGVKQTDQQTADCTTQAEDQANSETTLDNFEILLRWVMIVLFLPIIAPALLIGLSIILQWVGEGYKAES